jgi:hypothetical protein
VEEVRKGGEMEEGEMDVGKGEKKVWGRRRWTRCWETSKPGRGEMWEADRV